MSMTALPWSSSRANFDAREFRLSLTYRTVEELVGSNLFEPGDAIAGTMPIYANGAQPKKTTYGLRAYEAFSVSVADTESACQGPWYGIAGFQSFFDGKEKK